jgi:hypothetical protein
MFHCFIPFPRVPFPMYIFCLRRGPMPSGRFVGPCYLEFSGFVIRGPPRGGTV